MKYEQLDKDNFQITIPRITRIPRKPNIELAVIASELPDEVRVLASGGIDSEAMIKALSATKKVTAVVYKIYYEGELINEHDLAFIDNIFDSCAKAEFKQVELADFWSSSFYKNFLKRHKCVSPQLPLQAWMALNESNYGFTILPAIHPEPKQINGEVYVQIREKDFAIEHELAGFRNILVNPLCNSSEIIASILMCEEFRSFAEFNLKDGRARKTQQYQEYFGVYCPPRPKLTGFEKIQSIDNQKRKEIWDQYHHSSVDLYIKAEEMLANLFLIDATYSTLDNKYIKVIEKGPVEIFQAKME